MRAAVGDRGVDGLAALTAGQRTGVAHAERRAFHVANRYRPPAPTTTPRRNPKMNMDKSLTAPTAVFQVGILRKARYSKKVILTIGAQMMNKMQSAIAMTRTVASGPDGNQD